MILPNIASISQKEIRWSRKHLGTSSVTVGTAGCVLTCATIICRFYGKDIWPDWLNEQMVKVGGYADGNMWLWDKLSKVFPDIGIKELINCYDIPAPLDKIDKRLEEGHPVIVCVDFDPKPGIQTHFVVIFGKDEKGYYIADPWHGDVVLFQDRYGNPAKSIYALRMYDGILEEEEPQTPEIETPCPEIEDYSKKNNVILKKITPLIGEIHDFIPKWQKELESANRKVNNLEAKIITIDEERKNFQRLYKDKLDNDISKATGRQILSALISRFNPWKKQEKK